MKEQSFFIAFMGDSPTIRVLDYLLEVSDLDFSITDLAENAHVGRATLYRIWDNLIQNKILIHTRYVGKAKLFKLNKQNPKIRMLMKIDDMLIRESLNQKVKEQRAMELKT